MNKVYFAIVLHFHQPIGNFENIFQKAYQYCYKSYLELLSGYPELNMTFHISGSLLDYLEGRHPELIDLVKDMVSRRQIELMSGPYYEPILTTIPERDILGQISLMTEYIKRRFDVSPEGIWIPEKVWEPPLAKVFSKTGMRYCVLDEAHLIKVGLDKSDTYGYFLTGTDSLKLAVFPSDKRLRYTIPFKLPQETIDYFKDVATKRRNPLFVYCDDVEKFGLWPGTYEWVYKKRWLKDFFDTLMDNRAWIECIKLSDYLNSNPPSATIEELPEGSYEEMMNWAGGSWKTFLSKYPESNQMHKKMQYVSSKIEWARRRAKDKDSNRVFSAEKALYKSQCNCAYWHGLFGGLYFYHLRSGVYSYLIMAEGIADEILHSTKRNWLDLKKLDFDADGSNEFIMESPTFSLYFDPCEGGTLKELDYRPLALNLINTLSRKKEPYHNLSYPVDKYPRYCLRDHFISKDVKRENFTNASYEEFGVGDYRARKRGKDLILERELRISGIKLKLSKQIKIKTRREIEVTYHIEKKSSQAINILLAIEFNVTMPFLNADRYSYTYNGKNLGRLEMDGSAVSAKSFGISDSQKEFQFHFNFSKKTEDVWYFPVKALSQSEGTKTCNYQASCILPRWRLNFNKAKSWDSKINWIIELGGIS